MALLMEVFYYEEKGEGKPYGGSIYRYVFGYDATGLYGIVFPNFTERNGECPGTVSGLPGRGVFFGCETGGNRWFSDCSRKSGITEALSEKCASLRCHKKRRREFAAGYTENSIAVSGTYALDAWKKCILRKTLAGISTGRRWVGLCLHNENRKGISQKQFLLPFIDSY